MNEEKPILLVEDDRVDVMAVKRSVKQLQIKNPLITASNGEEALEYLRNKDNLLPIFILLDINMPKMNGIEFLQIMKQDERLRRLPVIVLTTSKEDQDRFESFQLGASGYMIKPVDYDQFVDIIKAIHTYWSLSQMSE